MYAIYNIDMALKYVVFSSTWGLCDSSTFVAIQTDIVIITIVMLKCNLSNCYCCWHVTAHFAHVSQLTTMYVCVCCTHVEMLYVWPDHTHFSLLSGLVLRHSRSYCSFKWYLVLEQLIGCTFGVVTLEVIVVKPVSD